MNNKRGEIMDYGNIKNAKDLADKLFNNSGTIIEFNSIRSYAGVLLNRDDMGEAKEFCRNQPRTVISSQCIKAAIRNACLRARSNRTRRAPEIVMAYLKTEYGIDDPEKIGSYLKVLFMLFTSGKDIKAVKEEDCKNYLISTPLTLCENDIHVIGDAVVRTFPADEEIKIDRVEDNNGKVSYKFNSGNPNREKFMVLLNELNTIIKASMVEYDIALFGRMSTSTVVSSTENASWFNHSYSTNKKHNDQDYFIAQDICLSASLFKELDEAKGAAHLNSRDINADTFYGYSGFSLNQYVQNIMIGVDFNDEAAVKQRLKEGFEYLLDVIEKTIITVPATMQHQMASFPLPVVYVSLKEGAVNLTYDNAFERVVPDGGDDGSSVLEESVRRMVEAINDNPFETGTVLKQYWISEKRFADMADIDGVNKCKLKEMISDLRGYLYEKAGIEL